jgi:hypothetical protein
VEQERVKVLYIASVPHSGSTVLANILGEVDGFFSAGELFFLWHILEMNRPCGCERNLPDCEVWSRILENAASGGDIPRPRTSWLNARSLPGLLVAERAGREPDALAPYKASLIRLYRGIQEATGCRVIVDSSKSPTYGHILEKTEGIDFAVVHLVRDPRGTAFSWRKQANFRLNTHPFKFGLIWSFWNAAIEFLWKRAGVPYLLVRYEDFVTEPDETIRRIVGLIGETAEQLPFVDSHTALFSTNHTIAGNQNRFRTGPVRLHPDDEWKSSVRPRTVLATTSVTWPLQWRYAYPLYASPSKTAPG